MRPSDRADGFSDRIRGVGFRRLLRAAGGRGVGSDEKFALGLGHAEEIGEEIEARRFAIDSSCAVMSVDIAGDVETPLAA